MKNQVTERDLRRPEFMHAQVEDLEFRDDGSIVRKDRWETTVRRMRSIFGVNIRHGFEVDDILRAAEAVMNLIPDRELPDDEEG